MRRDGRSNALPQNEHGNIVRVRFFMSPVSPAPMDAVRVDGGVDAVTCDAINALDAGDAMAIDEAVDEDDGSTLDEEREDVCRRKSSAKIVKGDR